MTTSATTDPTPLSSARAMLTRRTVTWRQASEGSAVLLALGGVAMAAAVLARLARLVAGRRAQDS